MLIFILTLLLHAFCCFLILYATDEPKALTQMCNGTFSIHFKRPSLDDLKKDTENIYVNKYIREVVLPSEHYYYILATIKCYLNWDADLTLATITLPFATFLLILQSFRRTFSIESKPLTFFISLAIAILLSVIARLIYYKTDSFKISYFRPYEYSYTVSDLKEKYEREIQNEYDYFELSEDNRFNNFLVSELTSYMESIAHTMHIRCALRKALIYIGGAVYIIFFFRIPNY